MEKEKVVQLLQHRRHDLANDIQVIHGYASMNMIDKVQEKLDDFIRATENERKLHMVAAPSFILWIELFQVHYTYFSLSYEVQDVVHLGEHDEWITKQCEKLIQEVQKQMNEEEMYNVHVTIYNDPLNKPCIQMSIDHVDLFLYERLQEFLRSDEQRQCTCSYGDEQLRYTIQTGE